MAKVAGRHIKGFSTTKLWIIIISTDILLHVLDTTEQVHLMGYMVGTFLVVMEPKLPYHCTNNQFESIGSINQLEKQAQKNIYKQRLSKWMALFL